MKNQKDAREPQNINMNEKKQFTVIFIVFQVLYFMITPGYCAKNEDSNLPKTIRSTNGVRGYTFDVCQ